MESINVTFRLAPMFGVECHATATSLMRRFDELQLPLQSCRWAQMSVRQQRVDIRSSMAVEAVVDMSRDEAINAHPQNSG
jgi:hypothetical protein